MSGEQEPRPRFPELDDAHAEAIRHASSDQPQSWEAHSGIGDLDAGMRAAQAARDAAPATGSGVLAEALYHFADNLEQQVSLLKGAKTKMWAGPAD